MLAFLDYFRLAFGTFRGNALRSILTLIGIVIGVATVITMMSMIEGLRREMNKQLSMLGADSFQITRRPQGMGPMNNEKYAKRPLITVADQKAILEHCPLIRAATSEDWEDGQKVETALRQTRPDVQLWAPTVDYMETNGVTVDQGRSYTEQEDLDERRVVVLGRDVSENLFPNNDAVGSEIRLRNRAFKVIGLLGRRGSLPGGGSQDNIVVVPLHSFRSLYGRARGNDISLAAVSPEKLSAAQDEVTRLMRERRHLKPDDENNFEFFSNDSMTKMFNQLSGVVSAATFGVCLLSLIVGGIGILNIMLVSVTERTREIGIRKALGARKRSILAQFAIEAVLLSLFGGLLGIGIGFAVAFLGRWTLDFPTAVPLWSVMASIAMSSAVGLIFGIYPAARAARLDPVEAMRAD